MSYTSPTTRSIAAYAPKSQRRKLLTNIVLIETLATHEPIVTLLLYLLVEWVHTPTPRPLHVCEGVWEVDSLGTGLSHVMRKRVEYERVRSI
jgi:hypothetical protein